MKIEYVCKYSYLSNRRACTLIAGKICLLTLIEAKRQTLPAISVHARLLDVLTRKIIFDLFPSATFEREIPEPLKKLKIRINDL